MTLAAITPTPASHHRFHLLDGMRGLAAVIVVLWHAGPYFGITGQPPNGFLAVDFFFCLSGFVIAFSYERRLRENMRWHQFAIARLIRLYPVYLLGLVAGVVLFVGVHGLHTAHRGYLAATALRNAFFLPLTNASPGIFALPFAFPFDFPAWSLSYELLANLLFAWLVVQRLASNAVLPIVAALSLAALIICSWNGGAINVGWSIGRPHLYLGIARVLLSFNLGVLLLRLSRFRSQATVHGWLPALLPVAALAFVFLAPLEWLRSNGAQLLIVTLAMPAIVYWAAHVTAPHSWTRICIVSGELSYPLYLLHVIVLTPLTLGWAMRLGRRTGIPYPLTLAVALIAIAYAVAKLYDEPLRKFCSRIFLGSKRPLAAVT